MLEENEALNNSFLTFRLGKELFAVHVSKVINILELITITHVPGSPKYLKGVVNLRGSVLATIDTRIRFNLPPIEYSKDTCIIVLSINIDNELIQVGALVDQVMEVIEISKKQILPSPSIGTSNKTKYIQGMYNFNDKFIMLLDVDDVFAADDLQFTDSKDDFFSDISK